MSQAEKHPILLVDDEPEMLFSLKRSAAGV